MEPRIISISGQKSHRNKMPLGTLQNNAELVKGNFINLRTVRGSLFHLLFSHASVLLFLLPPLTFSVFSTQFSHVLVCIPSFKNNFLLLFIMPRLFFTLQFYLHLSFFSDHSHLFLAIVSLSLIWLFRSQLLFSSLHFSLSDVFSSFIFASLRK